MIEDILRHIPDDMKIGEMKETDTPTINLVNSYKTYASKSSKLKSIDENITGAEFKQLLSKVDSPILLTMLYNYQKEYLQHTGQGCEKDSDYVLVDPKTKRNLFYIVVLFVTITFCFLALVIVIIEAIRGNLNVSDMFKVIVDFFKNIIDLFLKNPATVN